MMQTIGSWLVADANPAPAAAFIPGMNLVQPALSLSAVFLLLLLAAGLWRVYRGPEEADRMLAIQLLGTTFVGILLLLAVRLDQPSLLGVALLFVLLAVLVAVAFVRRTRGRTHARSHEHYRSRDKKPGGGGA